MLVVITALGLAPEVAKADFVCGPRIPVPNVNSSADEAYPSISADGLQLYFCDWEVFRPDGYGLADIWVATRQGTSDVWGDPCNLGPTVNSPLYEDTPSISADGLALFFSSYDRSDGLGSEDIYVTTRVAIDDPWGTPVNLGSTVNSSDYDWGPNVSADGLTLFFTSERPDGYGNGDIWMVTRQTTEDPWGEAVNLGPTVNSSSYEQEPSISHDGLTLFFVADRFRPGGYGGSDIWMVRRQTTKDPWGEATNLGPSFNTSLWETGPSISTDGSVLYFSSTLAEYFGGSGGKDLLQVSITPIVDLNGDGIVDAADMCIVVDHWGENYSLCDIGPTPFGDGVVDVQDLIVLAKHLFEEFPPGESVEVNESDDGGQVELALGEILVVTLESNPTAGYRWEQVDDPESILDQLGEAQFKPSEAGDPPLVGAGGWEIFRFKAMSAGQMTLQLVYRRPWEGVDPIKTFSLQVVVP